MTYFRYILITTVAGILLALIQGTTSSPVLTSIAIFTSDDETKTTRLVDEVAVQNGTSYLKELLSEGYPRNKKPLILFGNSSATNFLTSAVSNYMVELAERHQMPHGAGILAVPMKLTATTSELNCHMPIQPLSNSSIFTHQYDFDDDADGRQTAKTLTVHVQSIVEPIKLPFAVDFSLSCKDHNLTWATTRFITTHNQWLSFEIDKTSCLVKKSQTNHVSVCFRIYNANIKLSDGSSSPMERSFLVVRLQPLSVQALPQVNQAIDANTPVLPFADSPQAKGLRIFKRLFRREAPIAANFPYGALCHRETLHVNFRDNDIGLGILYPTSYSANYCSGSCGYPLSRKLATTRHAQWQTMLHEFGPVSAASTAERPPQSPCAPIKYSNKPLLIIRPDGSVANENFPDMTVEECGCV